MPGPILFVVALLFVVLEGVALAVFGWEQLTFQFGLAWVATIALHREFSTAGMIVAMLLVPIEWSVAGPAGYYASGIVVVFLFLSVLRGKIRPANVEMLFVGVGVGVVHALAMIIMYALTNPSSPVIGAIGANLFWSSVTLGVSTPLVNHLFGKFENRFKPIQNSQLSIPR